jgi:RNA polymerase sigma factor (sigma-70 family)
MNPSDQDLLRRFSATGDQEAFSTLVGRYAPLVLGACRRVLEDAHDAEDASQAVFLILAQKAASIDASKTVAPWLHRVAIDMARTVRKARIARERHQREAAAMKRSSNPCEFTEELDQALVALPERERMAIVLFHLEGHSLNEVAQLVAKPAGTVGVWLHRGRERLAALLRRRGMAMSTTAVIAGLGSLSAADVPSGFVATTALAATAFIKTGATTTAAATLALKGCHAMKCLALAKSAVLAASITMALGVAGIVAVAAEGQGRANAPLGSPDFHPSVERPVGWRGDGSGAYPGANPPLEWFRRPKGAYNAIRISATKPKGNGPEGQPLNMGMVRDWLVAGPFDAKDFTTALDDVSQPNEAGIAPATGDQLAGKPWKPLTISIANQSQNFRRMGVDFALMYGKQMQQGWQNKASSMEPQVAYASTYVYSGEAGKVLLRIEGSSIRVWLNGAAVKPPGEWDAAPQVDLAQGWNRLTIKAAAGKMNWYATAQFFPVPGSPYETKNIVWMAPMPGPSWSSPIIVGQKIFVNADAGTLVCLNKGDGQALWTRSTTFFDATTAEDRAKVPELAAKVQQLDQLMLTLPADLNAGLSSDGSKADGNSALQDKIKRKIDLEHEIQKGMAKAERKVYECWDNNRGTSTPTPVSDGKYVYVAYYGGDNGVGANAVACFDLDGKRIWSQFTGQTGIGEHGTHSTPVLSGNYLVYMSGAMLFGYEKATGKVAWQKKTTFGGCTGCSLIALKAGALDAVLVPMLGIFRSADGAQLWKTDVAADISTPALVDGVVYGMTGGRGVKQEGAAYYAFGLTPPVGDALAPKFLANVPWKGIGLDLSLLPDGSSFYGNTIIGSPLYHDGYLYVASEGGGLTVVDMQSKKAAYTHVLDELSPRLTWVFVVGICTGPTLAGKYIHIRDDQSQTLVIAPGPQYKELAKNVLWEPQPHGNPQETNQQEAQSSPFYEGGRIYYRTQGFLYCIGEK